MAAPVLLDLGILYRLLNKTPLCFFHALGPIQVVKSISMKAIEPSHKVLSVNFSNCSDWMYKLLLDTTSH